MGRFKDQADAEKVIKTCLAEGLAGTGEGTTMDDVIKATWSQFGEKGFNDIMQNTMRFQNEKGFGNLGGHFSLQDGAYNDGKLSLDEIQYMGKYDNMMISFRLPAKVEPNGSATLLEHAARRQNEENDLYHQIYQWWHNL